MNWIGIEYRDPLFGIIIVFLTIFAVSFIAYSFKKKKEKKAHTEHKELLQRFELGSLEVSEYVKLYTSNHLPLQSIMILSTLFIQKGDINKAISLFLALLEHTQDRSTKEEILEELGKAYYKTGLLQRSKEIFLQILKFSPRNKTSLQFLLLTYEKLKDYQNALATLEPLIELECDCSRDKVYLLAQTYIENALLSDEKKLDHIFTLYDKHPFLERILITFLLRFQKEYFWSNLHKFQLLDIIDILWYLPQQELDFVAIESNKFLKELYSAKSYINQANKSDIFELDMLILNQQRNQTDIKLDLNFEYSCKICKKTNYIYTHRCHSCNSVLSMYPISKITKLNFEANNSLQ